MYNKVLKCTTCRLKTLQYTRLKISPFLLKSRTLSTASDTGNMVDTEIINNKGILTLNKPDKLNCISEISLKNILKKLIEWENKVEMVIIRGEGRAFSSGGDVVLSAKRGLKNTAPNKELLKTAYTINGIVSQYPVPYVALIDGITMGTGAGLSIHGSVRVCTENTIFAMPETMIGLFTDNGVARLLLKMPHELGQYLALTGHRLKGADVFTTGLATHYAKGENIPTIFKGLVELKDPKNNLNEFLSKQTEDMSGSKLSLNPHLGVIEKAFSAPTVEEIIQRLQNDGSDFALKTLATLKKMSPISLKMSKKLIEMHKGRSLLESLIYEHRLAAAVIDGTVSMDFYEGTRALLIDKDMDPKWNPATLEEVTDENLEKIFKELPPEEEFNFTTTINELRENLKSNI